MQILGKRSKVLLTALCAVMLIAIGVSFAAWDSTAAKADGGNMSDYANAKVGDIVTFGKYYQTEVKDRINSQQVYMKTSLEWLIVDKDERSGELTLMTKYIIACGSYFGNYYDNGNRYDYNYGYHLNIVEGNPSNQAYVDSTARAYLNSLERFDMGGDAFNAEKGYIQSGKNSTSSTGLLASVGYSNKRYLTGLDSSSAAYSNRLYGLSEIYGDTKVYFQRDFYGSDGHNIYGERPTAIGFYDEAFSEEEKSLIKPKEVPGYTGYRWPDGNNDLSTKSYVEGTVDKVWLPSATELNLNLQTGNDSSDWTNSSDNASSTVFEYFKHYMNYYNPYNKVINNSLAVALQGQRTWISSNGRYGNYSIPVMLEGGSEVNMRISETANTSNTYWTRSPASHNYSDVCYIGAYGNFDFCDSADAKVGIRPCIILKY